MHCLFDIWHQESPPLPHMSTFWPAFDEAAIAAFLDGDTKEPTASRPMDREAAVVCRARIEAFIAKLEAFDEAEYPCKPEYLALEQERLQQLDLVIKAIDGIDNGTENDALFGPLNTLRMPEVVSYMKWHVESVNPPTPVVAEARTRLLAAWHDVVADDGVKRFFAGLDDYRRQLRPYVDSRFSFVDDLLAGYGTEQFAATDVIEILNMSLDKVFGSGRAGWRAELRPHAPNIFIDNAHKTIVVPEGRQFAIEHVKKLIIHEIGVHVVRSQNGRSSAERLAGLGMAGYGTAEEAMGVLMQLAPLETAGEATYWQSMLDIALMDFASSVTSFRQVYELASALLICLRLPSNDQIRATQRSAFITAARAYRMGTERLVDRSLTKYWRGLLMLDEYFRQRPLTDEVLQDMFLGKYDCRSQRQRYLITTPH